MSITQVMLHIICLLMFSFSAIQHLRGAYNIWRASKVMCAQWLLIWAGLTGAFLSGLFIILQIEWIINEQNLAVGAAVSWSWLLFDYLLAIYMVLIAEGVLVWSRWLAAPDKDRRWYDNIGVE